MQPNVIEKDVSNIQAGVDVFRWKITPKEQRRILGMFERYSGCRKKDLFRKKKSPEWLADIFLVSRIIFAKDIDPTTAIITGDDNINMACDEEILEITDKRHMECSLYVGRV